MSKESLWTPSGEIPISEILAKKRNEVIVYQDKKTPVVDPEEMLQHLAEARRIWKENQVGQREATVELRPAYPDLPVFIWLLNDSHIGSVFTDYERLLKDYQIVRETANFYTITNGDEVDNFLVDTAQAAGVYEDAISPEQQALIIQRLFKELAERQKLIACCLTEDSYCLTKSGWKKLKDIKIGDYVLAFNDRKGEEGFEYQKVTEKFEYDYEGDIYHFKTRNIDFTVTPEHRVILKTKYFKKNKKGKYRQKKWLNTDYRVERAEYLFERARKSRRSLGYFYIPIASKFKGCGYNLKDEEFALLGWIISEGTLCHKNSRYGINIYQSIKHNDKIEKIKSILDKLKIEYSIHRYVGKGLKSDGHWGNQRDWVTIYIKAKYARKYRKILKDKKEIPREILNNASFEQLNILFNALVEGDGHFATKTAGQFYTSSENLALQFLELALKTNRRAKIKYRERIIGGKLCKEWSVNFCSRNFVNLSNNKIPIIEKEYYKGKIYSLRVKSSFYLAMMNGKPFITGNSFGNHSDFIQRGGLSFEGTWLRDLPCPIFNCGGLLTLRVGSQEYKIAMTHRFWGFSKLNPTNACKRYLEHVYPEADIVYLGHSHIKEYLYFRRGGKERLAIIGGCYKVDDEFGLKRGIGAGGQMGGLVLKLSGQKREMEVLESVQTAREIFDLLVELRKMRI